MIVSVSILRISRYRSDVGNFELNATLDGCGCEVLAWRWRSPEFVKVGWPHPVKFAWPHPGPSCVTKVVGCNGTAWGGLGVPALLPQRQRRELGWPNRGASHPTPGADCGGVAPIRGPRVDRRGQHEVDDGTSPGQDHGEKQPDPRVGLLTQIPIPVAPRTGRYGPGLLKRGPPRLGPGSSPRRSSPRWRRPVVVTGHARRGTGTAPIPWGPGWVDDQHPASDVTVGALAPQV